MITLKDPTLFKERGFIAGQWVAADSGQATEIRNPASGEVLGSVPHMGTAETRRAIEAANAASAARTASAEFCGCNEAGNVAGDVANTRRTTRVRVSAFMRCLLAQKLPDSPLRQ